MAEIGTPAPTDPDRGDLDTVPRLEASEAGTAPTVGGTSATGTPRVRLWPARNPPDDRRITQRHAKEVPATVLMASSPAEAHAANDHDGLELDTWPPAGLDPCEAFLAGTLAAGWARVALAGDASARRYSRLTAVDGRTAILMDSRSEPESVEPFLRIAAHLRGLDLAAPAIIAADDASSLLLVEDLGADTMAARLAKAPYEAESLYGAAVDLLARLQAAPGPSGLVALTPLRAAGMITPLFEHYAPGTDPRMAALLTGRLAEALAAHAPEANVLSLRDFHAENLIWRPERNGANRIGLLDFQDAVLAPPEYDLASLLRDARRNTDDDLRAAMLRRFALATGRPERVVATATAVLGIQRNLRILGVFARLASVKGRQGYLDLMPRVWAHLEGDLGHPALAALRRAVIAAVPPPSAVVPSLRTAPR